MTALLSTCLTTLSSKTRCEASCIHIQCRLYCCDTAQGCKQPAYITQSNGFSLVLLQLLNLLRLLIRLLRHRSLHAGTQPLHVGVEALTGAGSTASRVHLAHGWPLLLGCGCHHVPAQPHPGTASRTPAASRVSHEPQSAAADTLCATGATEASLLSGLLQSGKAGLDRRATYWGKFWQCSYRC